jgi:hypothetical protein
VHRRETDKNGEILFCMREPTRIGLREVQRDIGGMLAKTTLLPATWSLSCGVTDLWVGNAYIKPPPTGGGGARMGLGRGGPSLTL